MNIGGKKPPHNKLNMAISRQTIMERRERKALLFGENRVLEIKLYF